MHVFNCSGLSVFAARCSDEVKEIILSMRRNVVRKQCPEMHEESPQSSEVEQCQVVRVLIHKKQTDNARKVGDPKATEEYGTQ